MSPAPVTLEVTLTGAPDAVDVAYTIANTSDAPVWLLDTLLVRDGGAWQAAPARAIVSRGEPGQVRFILGYLRAGSQRPEIEQGVAVSMPPAAHRLGPGEHVDGGFQVPRPLTPWHPYLEMARLRDPVRAVVEIGYLAGDEPRWDQQPAAPAGARVPDLPSVNAREQWASSAEQPLP
ncbi:MAG: hypothetical protein H6708_28175 [Kofleriaceae bacterium]|nr:hypothetical protein [Kofleriaceae bacterium]